MLNDNSFPAGHPPQACGCTAHSSNECGALGMRCACGAGGKTECVHGGTAGECSATCAVPTAPPADLTLFHRSAHWAQNASVIWLESPAGVGFSYCDYGDSGVACTANDTSTAVDNHNVLKAFFAGFPERAANDFFLTGESYAGIYVPTLAEQIMNDGGNKINLVGMAVGNGCWGSQVGLCAFGKDMARIQAEFLYGHGAISKSLRATIAGACGDPAAGPGTWDNSTSAACDAAISAMHEAAGDFETYNYYDQCYGTDGLTTTATTSVGALGEMGGEMTNPNPQPQLLPRKRTMGKRTMTAADRAAELAHLRAGGEFGAAVHVGLAPATGVGGALNDYTCGGQAAMSAWLANPAVVAALHVKAGTAGMKYGPRDRADLRPLYKTLAAKYRLLIFSGDTDMCVPYIGTEEWTSELGFDQTEAWRPWFSGTNASPNASITSGYVTNYDAGSHNFTFLTVKGAGHMVPEFKPVAAKAMLDRFMVGKPF